MAVCMAGLWVADLTITQLFLEKVAVKERGIVNGVQSSLNKLMDVLKFVLVIAFPHIETFGYLIILSFTFICLGWLSYAIFLRRARGHFFHFEKCGSSHGQANGDITDSHMAWYLIYLIHNLWSERNSWRDSWWIRTKFYTMNILWTEKNQNKAPKYFRMKTRLWLPVVFKSFIN